MKKLIATLCIVSALGAIAKPDKETTTPADEVVFTTENEGVTNNWTQADIQAALTLLNKKYQRDCVSPKGRTEWHGNVVQEIVDEDAETKTEIYEDGTSFVYAFRVKTPSQSVAQNNATLKTTVNTNGIPTSLAEARLRWAKNQETTNVVTKVVTAGEK